MYVRYLNSGFTVCQARPWHVGRPWLIKLNEAFARDIADNFTQEETYGRLVHNHSYRLLDRFTYEKKPISLGRCPKLPVPTAGAAPVNLLDWEITSNSPVISSISSRNY